MAGPNHTPRRDLEREFEHWLALALECERRQLSQDVSPASLGLAESVPQQILDRKKEKQHEQQSQ